MFLRSLQYQAASQEGEGPSEGPATSEQHRQGAGALDEPLPKSNPETFELQQEMTPGRATRPVEEPSPIAPPAEPVKHGEAGGGAGGGGGNDANTLV